MGGFKEITHVLGIVSPLDDIHLSLIRINH